MSSHTSLGNVFANSLTIIVSLLIVYFCSSVNCFGILGELLATKAIRTKNNNNFLIILPLIIIFLLFFNFVLLYKLELIILIKKIMSL